MSVWIVFCQTQPVVPMKFGYLDRSFRIFTRSCLSLIWNLPLTRRWNKICECCLLFFLNLRMDFHVFNYSGSSFCRHMYRVYSKGFYRCVIVHLSLNMCDFWKILMCLEVCLCCGNCYCQEWNFVMSDNLMRNSIFCPFPWKWVAFELCS